MNDHISAMKQALEALEYDNPSGRSATINKLRQAIEQAEQIVPSDYSNSHQRKWVGLTDEEIKEIIGPWGETPIKGYTRKLFDAIEAKLKEKNT
jgi:hypothetical protein